MVALPDQTSPKGVRTIRYSSSTKMDDEVENEVDTERQHARGIDTDGTLDSIGTISIRQSKKEPIALYELLEVGVVELLDCDSRPTFVIDLDPDEDVIKNPTGLTPVFCNASLRIYEELKDVVTGESEQVNSENSEDLPYEEFRNWVLSVTKFDDSKDIWPISLIWNNMLWTGSTIRKRWRLISGNKIFQTSKSLYGDLSSGPPSEVAGAGKPPLERFMSGSIKQVGDQKVSTRGSSTLVTSKALTITSKSSKGPQINSLNDIEDSAHNLPQSYASAPDWTVEMPEGAISEHIDFVRKIDWANTSIGAMDTWTSGFRQVANLLMANPHCAALFWGHDLTMMYNEAYRDIVAGRKHPDLMGSDFQGPFSETWDSLRPIFSECRRTGKSVSMINQYLPMEREGLLEETYFTWCFVPLYGQNKTILGFYNAPIETTQEIVHDRRTKTLRKLGDEAALAKTVQGFWRAVMAALEDNPYDAPFAILYSVTHESDDGEFSGTSSGSSLALKSCVLEGKIGVPEGHPAAPAKLDLKRAREGFIPSFREAMRNREPKRLEIRDGTLPESLIEDFEWRGYGDPCRDAIIFPVRPTTGEGVLGFLLLGVNPRRPYDESYQNFVEMLNRQLATSLASIILFEDEVRRGRTAAEAAAIERERLSDQLAIQTLRLQRMTESSLIGLYMINPEGLVVEANSTYYELTGLKKDEIAEMSFLGAMHADSVAPCSEMWRKVTVDKVQWTQELRLKRQWNDPATGEVINSWVLASAQPEYSADGQFHSVMGSIADISHLKWAQSIQNRRLEEAEQTRRAQNNFIDVTSHEMRNPLSAILQCADDISAAMAELQLSPNATNEKAAKILQESMEAAETIAFCAQHQQSIVSDILVVSKLDSELLEITPVVVQPTAVCKRAAKMFESECQKKGIKLDMFVKPSVNVLKVDWVSLDPNRVLQVLINLLTNAIKFTQSEHNRAITIRLGASKQAPQPYLEGFEYIPLKLKSSINSPVSEGGEWGSGESIFIQFEVQDTGRGLTDDEKKLLFLRFSQASPRTHAQYGGSGLGLFISRQLTELHGGKIGVQSQAGVGSTFGFYIKAHRSEPKHGRSLDSTLEPSLRQENHVAKMASRREDVSLNHRRSSSSLPQRPTPLPEIVLSSFSTHILVVEDNLVNQKVLVKQLRKIGCSVAAASHGGEALAYLEKTNRWAANAEKEPGERGEKVDIILMDLEMPVMDGMAAAKEIRRMEKEGKLKGKVPIIAVTANVRGEQIAAAKGTGMDDVVSKPFRIPELMKKIEEVLARYPNETDDV